MCGSSGVNVIEVSISCHGILIQPQAFKQTWRQCLLRTFSLILTISSQLLLVLTPLFFPGRHSLSAFWSFKDSLFLLQPILSTLFQRTSWVTPLLSKQRPHLPPLEVARAPTHSKNKYPICPI